MILEAFASGLPIVASRSGGITDIVKDGVNGFLVEEKRCQRHGRTDRQALER